MGNKPQKYKSLDLDKEAWHKNGETPFYDVMKNGKTGFIGHYYHYMMPQDGDLQKELQTYLYRSNTDGNIVKVLGVQTDEQGFGFCGSQKLVRVMTEQIVGRLSEIRGLKPKDQFTILFHALKGFKIIKDRMGPLAITPKLIGINSNGETKVWANENFGLNTIPENQKLEDCEENMIKALIKIIDKSSQKQIPHQLKNSLEHTNSLNRAIESVAQYTAYVTNQPILQNQIDMSMLAHLKMNKQEQKQLPPISTKTHNLDEPLILNRPVDNSERLNYEMNQNANMRPFGPFPIPKNSTTAHTKSKFISLSGKNQVQGNQYLQTNQLQKNAWTMRNPNSDNKNMVRFSYDKFKK